MCSRRNDRVLRSMEWDMVAEELEDVILGEMGVFLIREQNRGVVFVGLLH
jgi:hypothetical protein